MILLQVFFDIAGQKGRRSLFLSEIEVFLGILQVPIRAGVRTGWPRRLQFHFHFPRCIFQGMSWPGSTSSSEPQMKSALKSSMNSTRLFHIRVRVRVRVRRGLVSVMTSLQGLCRKWDHNTNPFSAPLVTDKSILFSLLKDLIYRPAPPGDQDLLLFQARNKPPGCR